MPNSYNLIDYSQRDTSYVSYLMKDGSRIRLHDGTGFGPEFSDLIYDVNIADLLLYYHDDPISATNSIKIGSQTWSPVNRYVNVIFNDFVNAGQREPSFKDVPPGKGITYLKKHGLYVSHKHMLKSHRAVINPMIPVVGLDSHVTFSGRLVKETTPFVFVMPQNSLGLSSFLDKFDQEVLYGKALKNLYASIGKKQKVNIGVMLGELKESCDLLSKAIFTVLMAIKAVKKGRMSEAYRLLKDYASENSSRGVGRRVSNRSQLEREATRIGGSRESVNRKLRKAGGKPLSKSDYAANSWLELQFGWLPVISDIYALIEYIQFTQMANKNVYSHFAGFASFGSSEGQPAFFSSLPTNLYDYELDIQYEARVSYHASFSAGSPFAALLNEIGLLNPASVAWELVPLSFVVDWFVPVGNWIESFTTTAGLDLLDVSETTKITSITTVKNIRLKDGSSQTYAIGPTFTEKYCSRSVLQNDKLPPYPKPYWNWKELISPWKIITSLALIKVLTK